jgi:hypothetical protein
MKFVRTLVVLSLIAAAASIAPPFAAGKSRRDDLATSLDRATVSNRIGDKFGFHSIVVNTGRATKPGLVAHLNIVSLRKGVYVDPEDWSSRRTQYLAPLRSGETVKLSWSVETVNSGDFALYVVLVPSRHPETLPLAVSPALALHSASQKTLNSGGVLPLVVGVPAFLGLVLVVARVRRRR